MQETQAKEIKLVPQASLSPSQRVQVQINSDLNNLFSNFDDSETIFNNWNADNLSLSNSLKNNTGVSFKKGTNFRKSPSPPKQAGKSGFNPTKYVPFKAGPNFEQDAYKKEFYTNGEANKKKIYQRLIEMVYLQISQQLDDSNANNALPPIFEQNKAKWAAMMMKSPKFQVVFASFSEEIKIILDEELAHNNKLVQDYLRYPHAQTKEEKSSPLKVWMPEKLPDNGLNLSILSKARGELSRIKSRFTERQTSQKEEEGRQGNTSMNKQKAFAVKKKEEVKKPMLNPAQQEMADRLAGLNERIADLEENQNELYDDVEDTRKEMSALEKLKQSKTPGGAGGRNFHIGEFKDGELMRMLRNWDQEEKPTPAEFKKYSLELWTSLDKFENDLKQMRLDGEMEIMKKKMVYESRVDAVRKAAAFRIDALETALNETKLKLARERERSEMLLSEMESFYLSKWVPNEKIEAAMKQAPPLVDQLKNDLNDQVVELTRVTNELKNGCQSMVFERENFKKQISDLKNQIQKSKNFNEKVQNDSKTVNELLLFYQRLVYDTIGKTKLYDEKSLTKQEDKELFWAIQVLNEERERIDQIEKKTLLVPDSKKYVVRLNKFCTDVHEIFQVLRIDQLFLAVHSVLDSRNLSSRNLARELKEYGVVEEADFVEHKEGEEADKSKKKSRKTKIKLAIGEMQKNDSAASLDSEFKFQLHPETKKRLANYIRVLQRAPEDQILETVVEVNLKEVEAKRAAEQERKLAEIAGVPYEAKEEESLFVSNGLPPYPAQVDRKSMTLKLAKMKSQREKDSKKWDAEEGKIQAKEKKAAVAAQKAQLKANPSQKRSIKINGETGEAYEDEESSSRLQSKMDTKAAPRRKISLLKVGVGKVLPNVSGVKKISGKELIGKLGSQVKGLLTKGKSIPKIEPVSSDGEAGEAYEVQKDPAKLFREAMSNFDQALAMRYLQEIESSQLMEKSETKINQNQFRELHSVFQSSLGTEITSKDYMAMFENTQFDSLIGIMNDVAKKYIKAVLTAQEGEKETEKPEVGDLESPRFEEKPIPFADCILAELDSSGRLMGFSIRPEMARVVFWNDNMSIRSVKKLIKNVNYLNRLLLQQDHEFLLGQKVGEGGKNKEFGCQVDIQPEVIPPPTPSEKSEKPKIEAPVIAPVVALSSHKKMPRDYNINAEKELLDLVKGHAIDILVRENPVSKPYYELIWSKLTFTDVCNYKMGKVYEQVPEEGFDEETRPDTELTVLQYFSVLFKELCQKIERAVPLWEKPDFDITKFVWRDDGVPSEIHYQPMIPLPSSITPPLDNLKSSLKEQKDGEVATITEKVSFAVPVSQKKQESINNPSASMSSAPSKSAFSKTKMLIDQKPASPVLVNNAEKRLQEAGTILKTPKTSLADRNTSLMRKQVVLASVLAATNSPSNEKQQIWTEERTKEEPLKPKGLPVKTTLNLELPALKPIMVTTASQTPKEMLPSRIIKEEVPVFQNKDILKQIDRAMADEMQKTVETLNEFITKIKMANTLEERRLLVQAGSTLFETEDTVTKSHFNQPQKDLKTSRTKKIQDLRSELQSNVNLLQQEIDQTNAMLVAGKNSINSGQFQTITKLTAVSVSGSGWLPDVRGKGSNVVLVPNPDLKPLIQRNGGSYQTLSPKRKVEKAGNPFKRDNELFSVKQLSVDIHRNPSHTLTEKTWAETTHLKQNYVQETSQSLQQDDSLFAGPSTDQSPPPMLRNGRVDSFFTKDPTQRKQLFRKTANQRSGDIESMLSSPSVSTFMVGAAPRLNLDQKTIKELSTQNVIFSPETQNFKTTREQTKTNEAMNFIRMENDKALKVLEAKKRPHH